MLGVGLAGVVASVGYALDDISFAVDSVAGSGWSASGISVQLKIPESASAASATIERLRLASPAAELRNVRIDCPAVEISTTVIACRNAHIVGTLPTLGAQTLTGRVVFGRRTGDLEVDLDGLRIGAGQVRISGAMRDSGWNVQLGARGIALEPLVKLAHEFKLPLPQLTASGTTTFSLSARGSGSVLAAGKIDAKFTELTASNSEGSLAAEKLSFDLQANLTQAGADWGFTAAVRSASGQAYAQPVFLDLGAHALALQARGKWTADGILHVDRFSLNHTDVAQGEGSATIQFDHVQPLRALALDLKSLQFPGAYTSYLQPLLLDTSFKSLSTAGAISGVLAIADGVPRSIDLAFAAVTVDDGVGNLMLKGLNGDWHWRDKPGNAAGGTSGTPPPASVRNASKTPDSQLRWSSGALFHLPLGAAELAFNSQGRDFRLLQAAHIPLLDGSIDLESLRIRNVGEPGVAYLVDATLQPVSVQQLCKAFGWPEFGGRVGGVISKLRMRDGVVTLGTKLQAQVFDGSVAISDLRLEQPFGQWPRLHSSIELNNLDLQLVTGAFSFGLITGRLSGTIQGLELFNWTPIAFDARLQTPTDDRSRHRISQRAVENIGSIGGGGAGVTAALSSGFLRFFENFNYDRLGVSCRLQNDVCVMDGVAPAANGGYYLVKGKGIPRIDVIGGAHRVDWPRLVQQLIAVTQSEGPVVK
ncbi:MAG TPA: hypothetical protein VGN07_12685 [Steroidobacteraceae bacterium]